MAIRTDIRPIDPQTLWVDYQEMGSVHRVGAKHGVTGDTVHQKLKKAGYRLNGTKWTPEEDDRLRAIYAATSDDDFKLDGIAAQMGRSRWGVAMRASRLGITDISRPSSAAMCAKMSDRMKDWWKDHDHPRGMAGKKHTIETLSVIGEKSHARWEHEKATATGNMAPEARRKRSEAFVARKATDPRFKKGWCRPKRGRRPDLGNMDFRSGWEANYARYLNHLVFIGKIHRWEFEPDTFWFEKIRRGVRSYLPDFKIWDTPDATPRYVEVKGWMDPKSATKLKRMKKYYPEVRLDLFGAKAYKILEARYSRQLAGWEFAGASTPLKAIPASDPAPAWLSGE